MRESFPAERWAVRRLEGGVSRRAGPARQREEVQLARTGDRTLQLDTKADAGCPTSTTLEGDVEDVSRQHIANRASVARPSGAAGTSACAGRPISSSRRRARHGGRRRGPDGAVDPGVPVTVTLTQIQWTQRPPRRGQRLLHLGHRAQGGAGRLVERHERRAPVPAARAAPETAATSSSRRRRTTDEGRSQRRRRRSTPSATATPRGSGTTTTASTSSPNARPTSRVRRRG